ARATDSPSEPEGPNCRQPCRSSRVRKYLRSFDSPLSDCGRVARYFASRAGGRHQSRIAGGRGGLLPHDLSLFCDEPIADGIGFLFAVAIEFSQPHLESPAVA